MMIHSGFNTFLLTLCLFFPSFCQAGETSRLVVNLNAGKHQTVVTYGTSLTAGGDWVGQLEETLNFIYPGKAKVINSGEGAMWSTWGVNHLEPRVIQNNPDTVIIEFAMNDAFLDYKTSVEQAKSNLEDMIDRILTAKQDCEIILMVMNPPTGVHLERRPKIEDYYQMYRELAENRKLLLVDHYPQWQKILKEQPGLFKKYVPDGIHPGKEGSLAVITPEILSSLGLAKTTSKSVRH